MKERLARFFSTPFQLVLVTSFSLIAAITIAVGAWSISNTITDYLSDSMNERVARDMQLAETYYNQKITELRGITTRLSNNLMVRRNIPSVLNGDEEARTILENQIANDLSSPGLAGNHLIVILDKDGNILAAQKLSPTGLLNRVDSGGKLFDFPIIRKAMLEGRPYAATEVIPAEILEQVNLEEEAKIAILQTAKASPEMYDTREGSAGLALSSVTPIKDESGEVLGAVVAFHLINNDFTLVDGIKSVAGIDTATIFFGDLRVSTNVMTQEYKRAIGTRLSQEVGDVVLKQGQAYVGPAFVVNENYITRYDPLRDHLGKVIGILYVGTRQASFQRLLNDFNQRIILVAVGMILFTIVITTPVSRMITNPLNQLKVLANANRRVAEGDMTVRVPVRAGGDVGLLESSFNSMLDTLQTTQDQLVQSEKLASLGQLSAGVAHELNNPLGTILLFSDIVKKELGPDSSYNDDLDIIVNETKRCKGIVAGLLEFARQNQVVAQPTDLNKLILSIVELQIGRCEALSVHILLMLHHDLQKIQADPDQITQVIVNLIENALDAMPEGGSLTIRTANGPEGMVTMEFEDSGTGIASENLNKLFTPFFTTKPVGKGTGLGLAIIYGIVKMHRGQIMVRSREGAGTTFTIQLPVKLLSVPKKRGGSADQLEGQATESEKIL